MTDILFKSECYQIVGACFDVYNEMGSGFLEAVYHECLAIELHQRGIPFVTKTPLDLRYKEKPLQQRYVPDFICFDLILVELKAIHEILNDHRAQVHNYLHAAKLKLGLLVNFGHFPRLEWERIVC